MGGQAFSSGPDPLYTPRMPPSVYYTVRDRCQAKLRTLFTEVVTPVEAPEKEDFGDVDVMVAIPVQPREDGVEPTKLTEQLALEIPDLLGSERTIYHPATSSVQMAIPWPSDLPPPPASNDSSPDDTTNPKQAHIQLDVSINLDSSTMRFHAFKHAHGDLWSILGHFISPLGLTVTDDAMYLRVPEMESGHRKLARIRLTSDLAAIVSFLALDPSPAVWTQPFASVDAMFEYAASSRLFWVSSEAPPPPQELPLPPRKRQRKSPARGEVAASERDISPDGEPTTGKELRGKERTRMIKRSLFRRWMEDFEPACRAAGKGILTEHQVFCKREEVREEAFKAFPGAEDEYKTRLREWRLSANLAEARVRIKAEVGKLSQKRADETQYDTHLRGCAISGLKKIVIDGDRSYEIQPPTSLKGEDGMFDLDAVAVFVRENWIAVGEAHMKHNLAKFWEAREKELKETENAGLEGKAAGLES